MIHKALNHPGRGGSLFEAELERAGAETVCERASYPLKSSVEQERLKCWDKKFDSSALRTSRRQKGKKVEGEK